MFINILIFATWNNRAIAAQNYSKHSTCSGILKGNILYICNSWDGIDVISLQSALSVFRKVVASPSQSFYIQCVRLFFVMTCSSWLRLSVCAEDWVTCHAATLPRTTHTLQVCQKYNAVMCNVVMCNVVMCNVVMCNVVTMSHPQSVSAMTTDQI